MKPHSWIVHKFGGTSVANSERYRKVTEVLLAEPGTHKAIVVSAMSGVTDKLIELVELARKNKTRVYRTKLEELKQQHLRAAQELDVLNALKSVLETDFSNLQDLLRAVWLGKSYSEETLELIAGHGEIWSAQLLNAYLHTQNAHGKSGVPASPLAGCPAGAHGPSRRDRAGRGLGSFQAPLSKVAQGTAIRPGW